MPCAFVAAATASTTANAAAAATVAASNDVDNENVFLLAGTYLLPSFRQLPARCLALSNGLQAPHVKGVFLIK